MCKQIATLKRFTVCKKKFFNPQIRVGAWLLKPSFLLF